MNRLRVRWEKARTILKTKGMGTLLKEIGLFLVEPIYYRKVFILGVTDWREELDVNKEDDKPNIDNIVLKIVRSNQEADKLEKEGFSFRYYPTDWNYNLTCYTDWLDKGVIACCTFVGKELGAISWVIPSQEAQDAINTYPLKVDYANHEVFTRGVWTNPKYRGQGLLRYSHRRRNRYMVKNGMNMAKSTISVANEAGRGLQKAFHTVIYGEGYEYGILRRKFWREKYFGRKEKSDSTS
jgi:hypothetical protein